MSPSFAVHSKTCNSFTRNRRTMLHAVSALRPSRSGSYSGHPHRLSTLPLQRGGVLAYGRRRLTSTTAASAAQGGSAVSTADSFTSLLQDALQNKAESASPPADPTPPLPPPEAPSPAASFDSILPLQQPPAQQLPSSLDEAVNAVTSAPTPSGLSGQRDVITTSAGDIVSTTAAEASRTLSNVSTAATQAVEAVKDSITGSTQSSLDAASETYSAFIGVASEATSGVVSDATTLLDGAMGSFMGTFTSAQETFTTGWSAVSSAVNSVAASSLEVYPVREIVEFASRYPAVPVVAVCATGGSAALWYINRFSGYAGGLPPQAAADVLQNESAAVLIDVRGFDERARNGVAGLIGSSLGKGVVVPVTLDGDVARRVSNAAELAMQITAAKIRAVRRVSSTSTVIVMDGGDGKAIGVAKALNKAGQHRTYVMEGGFRRWASDGLPVQAATDYEVSQLQMLGSRTGAIAGGVISKVREPVWALSLSAGALLGVLSIYHAHLALRYIGVSALLLTVSQKLLGYDSPRDALEDVQAAFASTKGVIASAKAALPRTTTLVTSTASSNGSTTEELDPTQPASEQGASMNLNSEATSV